MQRFSSKRTIIATPTNLQTYSRVHVQSNYNDGNQEQNKAMHVADSRPAIIDKHCNQQQESRRLVCSIHTTPNQVSIRKEKRIQMYASDDEENGRGGWREKTKSLRL